MNMKLHNLYRPRAIVAIIKITGFAILYCAFSIHGQAAEEPYDIISKKNLFHPDRKEWIMESSSKTADVGKANVPKLDPQKLQLKGTVIVGEERKAIVSTTGTMVAAGGRMPKRAAAPGAGNAEIYMAGDFIEGYLVKEVNEKNILLSSPDGQDKVTIFLHEGSTQRSSERKPDSPGLSLAATSPAAPSLAALSPTVSSPAVSSAPAPSPAKKRSLYVNKVESTKDLTDRMKKSQAILKGRESKNVREQVERDFKKLQKSFKTMSPEEQQDIILMKREIDRTKKEK